MTQETEKEDPRQVPPKKYAEERPGSRQQGDAPATGGLHDDEDDARGAFDDTGRDEVASGAAGERSGSSSSSSSAGSGDSAGRSSGDTGGSRGS
jgi:hypothetical protein